MKMNLSVKKELDHIKTGSLICYEVPHYPSDTKTKTPTKTEGYLIVLSRVGDTIEVWDSDRGFHIYSIEATAHVTTEIIL